MTFHIYADTGEKGGPFGSMPLAMKHTIALFLGNKKTKAVELRPSVSTAKGGYGETHRLSFYRYRHELVK